MMSYDGDMQGAGEEKLMGKRVELPSDGEGLEVEKQANLIETLRKKEKGNEVGYVYIRDGVLCGVGLGKNEGIQEKGIIDSPFTYYYRPTEEELARFSELNQDERSRVFNEDIVPRLQRVVVGVPGWGANRLIFEAQFIEKLKELTSEQAAGTGAIALSVMGAEGSLASDQKTKWGEMRFEDGADQVFVTLKDLGLTRKVVAVIGHSMGGWLAFRLRAKYKQEFANASFALVTPVIVGADPSGARPAWMMGADVGAEREHNRLLTDDWAWILRLTNALGWWQRAGLLKLDQQILGGRVVKAVMKRYMGEGGWKIDEILQVHLQEFLQNPDFIKNMSRILKSAPYIAGDETAALIAQNGGDKDILIAIAEMDRTLGPGLMRDFAQKGVGKDQIIEVVGEKDGHYLTQEKWEQVWEFVMKRLFE